MKPATTTALRHARRPAVRLLALLLAATLLHVPGATASGTASGTASASASAPSGGQDRSGKPYTPPLGAVFANPLNGNGRAILSQVYRSIQSSPKGSTIRLVVWNYDDPAITSALIEAKKRGVVVRVVVAESVRNRQFSRLKRYLDINPDDRSFAKRCHNACRSDRYVMHAKVFLFSKAGKRIHVSMFGSTNLTKAAGNRQWNDQTTTANKSLYDFFVQTFEEYAADRDVATDDDHFDNGRYRVVLFPVPTYNPIAEALAKVGCQAKNGRTVVRIAIAGWFDEFGVRIAQQVRRLWDNGCDLRIVTTLAGRKINAILKRRHGRGRVPIRTVAVDKNRDRVPERYLHMKSISVRGKYDGDDNTSVVFTGSPNWSGEARASDEVWVEIRRSPGLARAYAKFIDRMWTSPVAHRQALPLERTRPDHAEAARSGYELW